MVKQAPVAGEPEPFKLERFFAKYEHAGPRLLCVSDCEPLKMSEVLAMADDECKKLWENLGFKYTETSGHPLLRQEIIKTHYPSLGKESTIVLAPEEGIFIAMQLLLNEGDHFIATFPGYQSLYELGKSRGAELSQWAARESELGLRFYVQDLKQLMRPNTKLVVVNFPHNPTGFIPTRDEFQLIVDLCRERGAYLFCDEMYRMLELDSATRLPPACEVYEKGISLGGMSKTFSMPGLRIGWLAMQDEALMKRVAAYKDYTTICNSAPSEILALIGLRNADKLVARNMAMIRTNLSALTSFFERHADVFEFAPPLAGSICFPRLKSGDVDQFVDEMVTDHKILLLPASVYDFPSNRFRITLGRNNVPEYLDVFSNLIIEGKIRTMRPASR